MVMVAYGPSGGLVAVDKRWMMSSPGTGAESQSTYAGVGSVKAHEVFRSTTASKERWILDEHDNVIFRN
jgi:hypothetical protein